MGYNNLTAPFEGTNNPWNDLEAEISDLDYNDLTLDVNNEPPGSGEEWNTEM